MMPISNQLPTGLDEVDVIIAGGGTAACIVASRLSAADPELSILVIEWGRDNYNVPSVVTPALFFQNLIPSNKRAIFYKGVKSGALAGREPIIPSGGTLGGGSSINFMMYTRAQRTDFDSWETEGWSSKELIPFLKKIETFHGEGDADTHGYDGPVHISDGGFRCRETMKDFINAAERIGYSEIRDLQDLNSNNGFGTWMRNDGKHPNLHVVTETKVCRVLFDHELRATAVEITPNADFQTDVDAKELPKSIIKARKLVIVSCGAAGSPSVLERSGIGCPVVLNKASVPLVVNLPGVGHDYQDHNLIFYTYKTNLEPHQTLDSLVSGRKIVKELSAEESLQLGWNTVDIAAKVRPTDEEVAALGSDFKSAWDRDFRNNPNRPMMLMAPISSFLGDHSLVPTGQYVCVANYTAYPYSRGSIHITSPNVEDPPRFNLGIFSDKDDIDLKKHIWAYKKQRELMRRTEMYRGELEINHPSFSTNSKAACVSISHTDVPDVNEVVDIKYSAEDDKVIEQYLRENIGTTWHSLGTAKMAPRNELGAVDKYLNVYGVQGLKVVDLSVIPKNVGANTCNTAMLVGEKGADIILRELGYI